MLLGFLSPEAKFYKCNYFEHMDLADEILRTEYRINTYNEVDRLCDLGWCVIQDGFIGVTGAYNQTFTHKQEDWLDEHYDEMNYAQTLCYKQTRELSNLIKEDW